MKDENKTKNQLINELVEMRQQIAELNKSETQPEQDEEQIEGVTAEWRTIFDSVAEWVSIHDKDYQIVTVNKAFADALGMKPQAIIGNYCYELLHGEKEPCPDCAQKDALESGKPVRKEFFNSHLGIYVDVLSSPILNDRGEVTATVHIVRDITERKKMEEQLIQSSEKLRSTLDGTVSALASTAEQRDPYTAGHQRRVTQLTDAIAREMSLSEEQISAIHVAAIVHDVGKIYVPAEILSKPSRLTEIEFSLIKAHVEVSHDILKTIEFSWPIAQIVIQHHERIDGSGYPLGLSGEDILPEARILGVADVVEAMASHRPYRPALGIDKALLEILRNKGVLYDSNVVDACLRLFSEKGFEFE